MQIIQSVEDLKRHLASQIVQQLRDSGSTSVQLAKHVGLTTPRLSNIVQGKLDQFTVDKLVSVLLKMESDVTFTVEWKGDYPWLKK